MAGDRAAMEKVAKPVLLNLGCGTNKWPDYVNVDAYGDVDVRWDLNKLPYPWDDNSIDEISMLHVLEHIPDWWGAFSECARILKPGGLLRIHVPDESSATALTYRDHCHVFGMNSFFGIHGYVPGTNTWAATEQDSVPLVLRNYAQVPFKEYQWMTAWGARWLLRFCARHLRNFIWEQRFEFVKVGP